MTPDGISYLDMSDAVVAGDWRGIVDGYWSPLYPTLIGLTRLVARPTAAGEFAAVHALNFVLLALTIPAFEYFLRGLIARARDWRRSPLHGRWGVIGAYLIFGSLSLTMTPIELPTPDIIVTGAVLIAFGATLRLQNGTSIKRDAIVLGLALGAATLAKSFFVPWSIVHLTVVAIATRPLGPRAVATAAGTWALIAAPWCIALSAQLGHPSFGETGRLTYAWFVNNQEPPALLGMPAASSTPATNALLPGAGVTGDAPGTNPVWRDPVRFSGALRPHFDVRDQTHVVSSLFFYYVTGLAPLIFIALLAFLVAPSEARALAWRRAWVVWVPSLIAMALYGAIVVTTRYIVGFLVACMCLLGAALPWPRSIEPRRALAGVLVPLALFAIPVQSPQMLSLMSSVVMALSLAFATKHRSLATRLVVIPIGAFITRIMLSPVLPTVVPIGALLVVVGFWLLARSATRSGDAAGFARTIGLAAAATIGVLLVGRAAIRMYGDARALSSANVSWSAAQSLAAVGLTPGTRVAVIGSPYDAYWARAGRLHIVGVVPPPVMRLFWSFAPARRDSLLALFADERAAFAISTSSPINAAADSSWTPVAGAWVRALKR